MTDVSDNSFKKYNKSVMLPMYILIISDCIPLCALSCDIPPVMNLLRVFVLLSFQPFFLVIMLCIL